jgi:hypothetical protein
MDKTDVNAITALCDKGERLSLDTLQGGRWNTDAFLTLAMVHFLRKEIDPLPDSTIDESMDVSKDYLIIYMRNKNVDTLRAYMVQVRQIISEIYHEASADEKALIKESIEKMRLMS